MNVFDLRDRLVADYASYTRSFIKISDPVERASDPANKERWRAKTAMRRPLQHIRRNLGRHGHRPISVLMLLLVGHLNRSTDLRAQDAQATRAEEVMETVRTAPLVGSPEVEIYTFSQAQLEKVGIDDKRLKEDAELILRRNGIPISRVCLPKSNCGRLILDVNVISVEGSGLVRYLLRLDYREWVFQMREPARVAVFASVWDALEHGTVGGKRLSEVRDATKELLDKFALDYLRANPAQPKPKTR